MITEIWKPIPGWEGYYSVSTTGKVRSESRTITDSIGHTYEIPERILKQGLDNSGKRYFRVTLSRNSIARYIQVHRLVAWAFLGKQRKGIEVRHLDGNCKNNNLENLCYGTKSDNINDAKKHGTFPLYEKRPGAILVKDNVIEILNSNEKTSVLAKRFNVKQGTISQIKRRETWKFV